MNFPSISNPFPLRRLRYVAKELPNEPAETPYYLAARLETRSTTTPRPVEPTAPVPTSLIMADAQKAAMTAAAGARAIATDESRGSKPIWYDQRRALILEQLGARRAIVINYVQLIRYGTSNQKWDNGEMFDIQI